MCNRKSGKRTTYLLSPNIMYKCYLLIILCDFLKQRRDTMARIVDSKVIDWVVVIRFVPSSKLTVIGQEFESL